jgi:hypothetical protein
MKKRRFILMLTFILVFTFTLSVYAKKWPFPNRDWGLRFGKATSKSAVKDVIQGIIRRNGFPVGMSGAYYKGKPTIFVLYIRNKSKKHKINRIIINKYKRISKMRRDLKRKIKSNYTPMGFTFFKRAFWILYIKSKTISTSDFKFVIARQNVSSIRKAVYKLQKRNMFPVGIAFNRRRKQVALLAIKDRSAGNLRFMTLTHPSLYGRNIRRFMGQVTRYRKRGWIPYSFSNLYSKTIIFWFKSRRR